MSEKGDLVPIDTLNPDFAFEKLVTELNSNLTNSKQFNVLKDHLNHSTLRKTLEKSPKILVLYCHGDQKDNFAHLNFENKQKPSLVHKYEQ